MRSLRSGAYMLIYGTTQLIVACESRLTIGTRSSALTTVGSWFYELEFKNVEVIIDEADNSVDFVVNEWPTEGKHTERKVIPPGDRAAVKEEGWACYGDQGSVRESTTCSKVNAALYPLMTILPLRR